MAKEPKPRAPTWQDRAASLTATTGYTHHEPGAIRPRPGKLAWLKNTQVVLIVYDMRQKLWASDAEKALYEAAGSQAKGSVGGNRISMPVSNTYEFVVREISAVDGTRYRIPPMSHLKWYSGDRPPVDTTPDDPEHEAKVAGAMAVSMKRGKQWVMRCDACWRAGHHEHAASLHNDPKAAERAAIAHRCKT